MASRAAAAGSSRSIRRSSSAARATAAPRTAALPTAARPTASGRHVRSASDVGLADAHAGEADVHAVRHRAALHGAEDAEPDALVLVALERRVALVRRSARIVEMAAAALRARLASTLGRRVVAADLRGRALG